MIQHGYSVRPRSTAAIAAIAEQFIRECCPDHLTAAKPLDIAHLVDYGLERKRIVVYPVGIEDLPDAEAETRAGSSGWLEILMREEFYDALFEKNSRTVRARSTLGHEIGHAVLHERELRTGRAQPHVLAMKRALRSDLPAYRDSEWQAFVFAGALLIPRPALRLVGWADTYAVADRFEVSESLVRSHLKRINSIL